MSIVHLNNGKFPVLQFLLLKMEIVVIAKGYGVKGIGTNDKVDENTCL
jgi:hypothetical protein